MEQMEPMEYKVAQREILKLIGINLDYYKGPQMQRRLKAYLSRSGQATWPSFFRELGADEDKLGAFRDYLTINVSSFFRDTKKYQDLEQKVLPALLKVNRRLRIWSAGCSRGQEPYTLAMLLSEMAGPYNQHRILATDVDHSALGLAQAGGPYVADDVENVPPALLKRYFTQEEAGYRVADDLRRRIVFRQHNLLEDPFESNLDLIICRNVVIYFTGPVKDRLYQRFYQALRPGGILFVGGTEVVPQANAIGYKVIGISFYQRNGAV